MSKKIKPEVPPPSTGALSIKDVVVADPSVEFTVETSGFGELQWLQDFEVQLSISDPNSTPPGKFNSVGKIVVANLSVDKGAYFYFTFGDPEYKPGKVYTMCMLFSAYNPTTGEPINIPGNPVYVKVYGGGEIK
jgi:hypothetical protein